MGVEFTNPLESIKVASPCSADWEAMVGNNRQRFCGQCKLNVYNLSGMTRQEAENLLMNSEGRLCARFFRRTDGTIITQDCPVGWQAIRQRMSKVWTAVASVLITAVGSIGVTSYLSQADTLVSETNGPVMISPQNQPVMGDIAMEENSDPATMGNVAVDQIESHEPRMGKIAMNRTKRSPR